MSTFGPVGREEGPWAHLQSPSEREPGKRGEVQGPGPKATDTAEEVDFIQGAVGRHCGVLRREIYELMSASGNCSWDIGTPGQGWWDNGSLQLF